MDEFIINGASSDSSDAECLHKYPSIPPSIPRQSINNELYSASEATAIPQTSSTPISIPQSSDPPPVQQSSDPLPVPQSTDAPPVPQCPNPNPNAMSSSPALEPSSPSPSPSNPLLRPEFPSFQTSTPNYIAKKQFHTPLSISQPSTAPATPPTYGEPTLTPPPRSPAAVYTPASGDARSHPPDGTSSDKSSETAVVGPSRTPNTALSRKESYKAQRQHYRREKKRAASALLHSIEDPSVVVLADWLKVRGSLKSWTKLWCVLKPGLLLLYKSPKAKSSHWVGTVLLASCQVIERPSKKDGFCFKLYHPLEQSIWAPRGPHNETIGAVVQPLPTAHLIFRAPSQAAGHCWLDGLELALTCTNAMLRCSNRKAELVAADTAVDTNISHEELEKHFNEHVLRDAHLCSSPPLMCVDDYSPKRHSSCERKASYQVPKKPKPTRKASKWAQFMESIEKMSKDIEMSTDSQTPESEKKDEKSFLDFHFFKKMDVFERNSPSTSSVKLIPKPNVSGAITSKSLASSPSKTKIETITKKSPILRCFELPKLPITDKIKIKDKLSPTSIIEENLTKFFFSNLTKRRSSTPIMRKSTLIEKRISDLRESGAKTDSENDDGMNRYHVKSRKQVKSSEILCDTLDNIIITKTAPSVEKFHRYSSSSTDDANDGFIRKPLYLRDCQTPEKFSLIDYRKLPSNSLNSRSAARLDDRCSSQSAYVSGDVCANELVGATDSESEASRGMPEARQTPQQILARLQACYLEDPDRDVGQAGELVEEVNEENKSLLWFLLKQVRPGMDLSKVVLPTFILEPRSFLDKLSDSYYHSDILGQASQIEDPYGRFIGVLRWYLSGLYKKPKGLKKPYNPVLGEVFRCCWHGSNSSDYTFYIAEQVSHHPPVTAFYVSNRKDGFVVEGSLLARSKFYGNSTSAILEGTAKVHLLKWDETYYTTAPYAHCKGLVIGTLSMELGGKVHIICPNTGYQADIEFKLRSFLGGSDQTNAIYARIKKGKETVATLEGYWDGRIDIKDKRSGEETNFLDVAVLKEQRLTRFLMKLDLQEPTESQRLWVKVSEAIANDDLIAATEQKTIIEEAQRERARAQNGVWVPRLFSKDSEGDLPEGFIDQGWGYNYKNLGQWQSHDLIDYEEEFQVKSLTGGVKVGMVRTMDSKQHDIIETDSSQEAAPRQKRTIKQSLLAIDSALHNQANAIEKLTKNITLLTESQRQATASQRHHLQNTPSTSHSQDLLIGFVCAIVLQAVLSWLFSTKQ